MKISFWQIFRLVFVIFFLYLIRDAFYRWDGFSYYGSFSEFLPSAAFTSILWMLVAVLTAGFVSISLILIKLSVNTLEQLYRRHIQKLEADHLYLFIIVFLSLGSLAWLVKRHLVADSISSSQLKISVLFCVTGLSVFFVWIFRCRAHMLIGLTVRWMAIIQERITPLVWLFGIWIALSLPLVAYNTWFNNADKITSQEFIKYPLKTGSRPNIILLTFDAMTARDMSLYGYSRPTTPFISAWARGALVFNRVQAASNFTAPATASLMTGKRVWSHLRYSRMPESRPVRMKTENLPLLLKKNGYFTMAFIANPLASVKKMEISAFFDIAPSPSTNWKINGAFMAIYVFLASEFGEKIKMFDWILQEDFEFYFILQKITGWFQSDVVNTQYPPEIAFNKFLRALDKTRQEPYFVWIHVNPPHSPYLAPEPYKGMFDSSLRLRSLNDLSLEWNDIYEFLSKHDRLPDSVNILRARYDEFIRYCDKQFEEFIMDLKKENYIKNTVILLSSDHGESFEHNSLGHGGTLYEPETHIPLIIKMPDQDNGKLIDDLVEQADIPATILDLAGIQVPPWMDGASLLPLLDGGGGQTKPVFSMNLERNKLGHKIENGMIAAWEGDYKLIHYLDNKKSLLFNLKEDPDELNNLSEKESEIAGHLLSLITEDLGRANDKIKNKE
jgi:arylsulfatase A-like enzyme